MIIESILALIGLLGTTGAIASQEYKKPKEQDDNLDDNIFSLTDFQNNMFDENIKRILDDSHKMCQSLGQGKSVYSQTSYWENPITGDYMKHRFDIEAED